MVEVLLLHLIGAADAKKPFFSSSLMLQTNKLERLSLAPSKHNQFRARKAVAYSDVESVRCSAQPLHSQTLDSAV